MKLQGIFAEVTTPFDHKGEIYKVKIEHNIEQWNRTTLAGYEVCGDAGEGELLAHEEKVAVWEMVAKYAAAEKVLIAAAAMPGVRETVSLTNRAAELGYKAALIAAPRAPAETQVLYFRSVADQSKLPVIVDGARPEAARAIEHPNVIGIRDAGGRVARPGLPVLAGSVSQLWPALQAGAAGAILSFAAAAPYACIAIWEAHRTREEEAGIDWQKRIAHAAELVSPSGHGVPGLKHAMDLNGYYGGPPRLPLVVPTPEARREIEAAFSGFKG
jgi:4-hydroxy-2-oxoglutarate aldolase